ncbi:hypothetical protein Plhal304r1_c006g0026641 [Plasmopara halstedii]
MFPQLLESVCLQPALLASLPPVEARVSICELYTRFEYLYTFTFLQLIISKIFVFGIFNAPRVLFSVVNFMESYIVAHVLNLVELHSTRSMNFHV